MMNAAQIARATQVADALYGLIDREGLSIAGGLAADSFAKLEPEHDLDPPVLALSFQDGSHVFVTVTVE